ncbi:heavy metal translocating P-type ATPase [Aeriscardovia aeriphila]|uniref:ATPase n=1 Tax=Aeriscardovia aeriphila TaxID=218139 RepID=A0A261FBF5_9BIFI|nr:heavy metal translocating P-type ATPase [Aeriscardovia aeriphila]NYI25359.1 Cu2+-exporting ATPase [Aeriscardovia aeriphila]OZG56487.1 ATPase [Aeriscardovia aeriphila]
MPENQMPQHEATKEEKCPVCGMPNCHMDHSNMGTDHTMHNMHNMHNMDHTHHDMSDMHHDMSDMHMEHMKHMHDMTSMDHSDHMDHMDMDHMDHMSHMGHDMHDMSHMDHMHHDMSDVSAANRAMFGMHAAMFRRLFWIALALGIPTIALDPMFAMLLHYSLPDNLVMRLIPAALGTLMYVWPGRPFLTDGVSEAKRKKPGMMLLILLGITVAFVASWLATLNILAIPTFWWELALLIIIMLAGHWIEMASVASTSTELDAFAALLPRQAHVLDSAENLASAHDVDLAQLQPGDIVLVKSGETVPADATILSGTGSLNESMLTGESLPVTRHTGDHVTAGTILTDSSLVVEVQATGSHTTLSTIQRLVETAQAKKSPTQLLADRAAALLFWYALVAGVLAFAVWFAVSANLPVALERLITVLVIACPHALGLAIPLVVSTAMGDAAANGILISDRSALEKLVSVSTVAFDKTGTLTTGTPEVVDVVALSQIISADDALLWAASAESASEHPLAQAIVRKAVGDSPADSHHALPSASAFTSTPGVGVSAQVEGHHVLVGGKALLTAHDVSLPSDFAWIDPKFGPTTTVFVVVDGVLSLALRLKDTVRTSSRHAIDELHRMGVRTVMITGDSDEVAQSVASELGIDEVLSNIRPDQKADAISSLQSNGDHSDSAHSDHTHGDCAHNGHAQVVAMVGDGINDAPALAQADIGIAIGGGTDVAASSAQIVLGSSDPAQVARAIQISRLTVRKMHQNLWWAAGYNLITVPLAAGVLAWPPLNFSLPMAVGAALMALSTVIVVINSRLLDWQLKK